MRIHASPLPVVKHGPQPVIITALACAVFHFGINYINTLFLSIAGKAGKYAISTMLDHRIMIGGDKKLIGASCAADKIHNRVRWPHNRVLSFADIVCIQHMEFPIAKAVMPVRKIVPRIKL